MSANIVFNEVVSQDENEPAVRLQIEQLDESGFSWVVTDESDTEMIAQGYARFQPMALIIGKIAAKLWITRNMPEFDPAAADSGQLGDLSYNGFYFAESIDEVCEEKGQAAPFWLGFVRDLDSRIDEIIEAADNEDELEDMPEFEDDPEFTDEELEDRGELDFEESESVDE